MAPPSAAWYKFPSRETLSSATYHSNSIGPEFFTCVKPAAVLEEAISVQLHPGMWPPDRRLEGYNSFFKKRFRYDRSEPTPPEKKLGIVGGDQVGNSALDEIQELIVEGITAGYWIRDPLLDQSIHFHRYGAALTLTWALARAPDGRDAESHGSKYFGEMRLAFIRGNLLSLEDDSERVNVFLMSNLTAESVFVLKGRIEQEFEATYLKLVLRCEALSEE